MAKMNIMRPTGSEAFNLISAFKENENTYLVFDSEKMGSMGLPIIYISKYTDRLEKITDENEWQSVKNYLKGIISGTNFHYVKMGDSVNADEVYYTPLTLPQASFDMIKSRYVVIDEGAPASVILENASTPSIPQMVTSMENSTATSVSPEVAPITPNVSLEPAVAPANPVFVEPIREVSVPETPVAPVMPTVEASSNMTSTMNVTPVSPSSVVEEETSTLEEAITQAIPIVSATTNSAVAPEPVVTNNEKLENIFLKDKETFLKACENMFDALVSKYEKQLQDVEKREQEVLRKEQEIESKMKNANEHLANAEAREQVANIAHDNAQRVMDLSNFMPSNPNGNQIGVI